MVDARRFVLAGLHVRLRSLEAGDLEAMARHAESNLVDAADRAEELKRLRRSVTAPANLTDDGFWSLVVEHHGELAGDIQARAPRFGFPPGVCEIGITLSPYARGQGVGTEAVQLFTEHLHAAGWARVQASTAVANLSMRRVLDRCGFRLEGVLRGYAPAESGRLGSTLREDYVMYASVVHP